MIFPIKMVCLHCKVYNNLLGSTKKKTYDVNTTGDTFFAKYSNVLFPTVVEANETELAEVYCLIFNVLSVGACTGEGYSITISSV